MGGLPGKGKGKPMEPNKAIIKKLCLAAFPDYKGRKFYCREFKPMSVSSYWDEGSRTYYAFVDANGTCVNLPSNHPAYERGAINFIGYLPENVAMVSRAVCCGKECGLTLFYSTPKVESLSVQLALA